MNGTDAEAGTRLDDTVEMDPSWLAPCGLSPEVLAADAATYARIQARSTAVTVESFTVAVACGRDEVIPYRLTVSGWRAAEK